VLNTPIVARAGTGIHFLVHRHARRRVTSVHAQYTTWFLGEARLARRYRDQRRRRGYPMPSGRHIAAQAKICMDGAARDIASPFPQT